MIEKIVFIDYENITRIDFSEIDGKTKLFLMVGNSQTKKAATYSHQAIDAASSVELVKVRGTGSNALDFHIAYYLGKLIDLNNNIKFIIFSNDKGYDPLIKHLTEEGIKIKRISVDNEVEKKKEKESSVIVKQVKKPSKNSLYDKAYTIIKEMPKKNRPKKVVGFKSYIKIALGNKNSDVEIDEIFDEFIKNNIVIILENQKIQISV